jgi:hypothetical protein
MKFGLDAIYEAMNKGKNYEPANHFEDPQGQVRSSC